MRPLAIATAITAALCVAGCGSSVISRVPSVGAVPLIPRTRTLIHQTRCDRGANAYCAVQLVVVGRGYSSSGAMLGAERQHLVALGWSLTHTNTGVERAAESPGHKLRLTFAAAFLDLKGIDIGWVQRSRTIGRVLAETMFDRMPALSLMLESGSS